ncbi:MAG: NUDIX domain-containing protein [Acidimicrobiales bacterium]
MTGEATAPTEPPFRPVSEELIYQGWIISVYKGRFEGPDGDQFDRDIVRHPGAVAAVAVDDDDHVFLVRQFRACVNAELWEIPAGKRDVADEPPEVTAARELEEEVGRRPDVIEPLLELYHSPGFCDEYGYIFLARGLTPVEQRLDGPEELAMTVARVPAAEAVAMALDGRITDAKSIAGILAAARRLGW